MILECAHCGTRFLVDPAAIGAEGRRVRCGRCRHEWWARAPVAAVEEPPLDFAPGAPIEPRPIPPGSNLPALREPPPRRTREVVGWLLLLAFVAAAAVAVLARDGIMARYPATRTLYSWFGVKLPAPGAGLRIVDVVGARDPAASLLVIEGRIENATRSRREVPLLRGALIDEAGAAFHAWTFQAPEVELAPGDSVAFRTSVPRPARTIGQVSITFVAPR